MRAELCRGPLEVLWHAISGCWPKPTGTYSILYMKSLTAAVQAAAVVGFIRLVESNRWLKANHPRGHPMMGEALPKLSLIVLVEKSIFPQTVTRSAA
jgi:hypothetical protein